MPSVTFGADWWGRTIRIRLGRRASMRSRGFLLISRTSSHRRALLVRKKGATLSSRCTQPTRKATFGQLAEGDGELDDQRSTIRELQPWSNVDGFLSMPRLDRVQWTTACPCAASNVSRLKVLAAWTQGLDALGAWTRALVALYECVDRPRRCAPAPARPRIEIYRSRLSSTDRRPRAP